MIAGDLNLDLVKPTHQSAALGHCGLVGHNFWSLSNKPQQVYRLRLLLNPFVCVCVCVCVRKRVIVTRPVALGHGLIFYHIYFSISNGMHS